MKASILKSSKNTCSYSAKTENNILVVFSAPGGIKLDIGDCLEIDLVNVLQTKEVTVLKTQETIRINLRENDLHDLNLEVKHGVSRTPNKERLERI